MLEGLNRYGWGFFVFHDPTLQITANSLKGIDANDPLGCRNYNRNGMDCMRIFVL
jgi:hypothetical protein